MPNKGWIKTHYVWIAGVILWSFQDCEDPFLFICLFWYPLSMMCPPPSQTHKIKKNKWTFKMCLTVSLTQPILLHCLAILTIISTTAPPTSSSSWASSNIKEKGKDTNEVVGENPFLIGVHLIKEVKFTKISFLEKTG